MPHIITRNVDSVEQNWLKQLANGISDPQKLLEQLEIDPEPWQNGFDARKLFAQRVPQSFVERMQKGNPFDPLLRQVLPLSAEFEVHPGYSNDPLQEQNNDIPGLLHKYRNRALMIVKGGCAINCVTASVAISLTKKTRAIKLRGSKASTTSLSTMS